MNCASEVLAVTGRAWGRSRCFQISVAFWGGNSAVSCVAAMGRVCLGVVRGWAVVHLIRPHERDEAELGILCDEMRNGSDVGSTRRRPHQILDSGAYAIHSSVFHTHPRQAAAAACISAAQTPSRDPSRWATSSLSPPHPSPS